MREIVEIPLVSLSIAKVNVRRHGGRDIASLARSIETQGLIYPLIVRASGSGHEVVAGKRRYLALKKLGRECSPCIVIAFGEDAAAIELSLAENVERVPMCPLDQCAAFHALVRQGRSEAEIAHSFAVPVATVRKRLALAGLVPEAHARYRDGDIDDKVLEALTLGSKPRQRAYLKMLADPEQSPPPVWQLKQWMLGGTSINASAALFDLADYQGGITSDLFNEATYLTDADAFWRLQRAEIDSRVADLTAKGWQTVTVLEPDQPFYAHQYEPATKAQGGHVIVKLNADGHVQIEKGLLPQSDLRAARKRGADASGHPKRPGQTAAAAVAAGDATLSEPRPQPELSAALTNYVDLVRQSTVAAALAKKPKLALRVMVAQLIVGTALVTATRDRRHAASSEIATSVATLGSETEQQAARGQALALLGFAPEDGLTNAALAGHRLAAVLDKLMALSDAEVMTIVAAIAAETLPIGSEIIDALGVTLRADCSAHWTPDQTFFDLVRGKRVIEGMAKKVLGKFAANALTGTQSRAKTKIAEAVAKGAKMAGDGRPRWQPRWTEFPRSSYLDAAPTEAAVPRLMAAE